MIYTWDTYDYQDIINADTVENKKHKYKNLVCAFDIETTSIPEIEQAVMYIWQCQIEDKTIIGRTWEEFKLFLKKIIKCLGSYTLVLYVHNLSYEFQFLRGIYPFDPEEVFAVDSRKILKCTMYDNHIEFRCSYLHSNMGLARFLQSMKVEAQKLSGDKFDYSKQRFYCTDLTDYEMKYCINDVKGLVQALKTEMQKDGDNLITIPLTSTGYVRRDVKAAMKLYNYNQLHDMLPPYDVYVMLREAFRGGNTHANRLYSDVIIDQKHTGGRKILSADRSSSYPDVQVNQLFPMSKWYLLKDTSEDHIIELLQKGKKALLMRVSFTGLDLLDHTWGCPYISMDKSRNTVNTVRDNGRILAADYLEMTITDIDLKIILSEYYFEHINFLKVYWSRYGELPPQITDLTKEYYHRKTTLKGSTNEDDEYFYMKSKNKLNSIYGMSAQDPVKQDILFEGGEFKVQEENEEELLLKSYKTAYQSYAWGVWVTAHARYMLEQGIRLVHDTKDAYFLYTDTDSVKYVGDVDFTEFNNARIKASKESGAYATDMNGEVHYMGVFEVDGVYDEFKTMGSKKYCYVDEKGLHVTIAGVNKKKGAIELEKYGGLEAFKEGFTFKDAGGTESIYNDNPEVTSYVTPENIEIKITSNVFIKDSTYTLGVTEEYRRLLNGELYI